MINSGPSLVLQLRNLLSKKDNHQNSGEWEGFQTMLSLFLTCTKYSEATIKFTFVCLSSVRKAMMGMWFSQLKF